MQKEQLERIERVTGAITGDTHPIGSIAYQWGEGAARNDVFIVVKVSAGYWPRLDSLSDADAATLRASGIDVSMWRGGGTSGHVVK